jgi:hypothetical protein
MTEPVHILAYCRKPELLPAATLVFKTLRVGFPAAPVTVHFGKGIQCKTEIVQAFDDIGAAEVVELPERTRHDIWVRELIEQEEEPFWICDTDVVFWKAFRHQPDGSALAGVRTPSFFEPWSGTQYRERLHTCLMRIDPAAFIKSEIQYLARFPSEPFIPFIDMVAQQYQPARHNGTVTQHFYDTLATAWHAFGGQDFTTEQIESFDHLNCATWVDIIAPSLDFDIVGAHKAVYEDHTHLRGAWARQFQWFAEHKVQP